MMPSLPRQAAPPDEPSRPSEDRRHMIRRRALTLLIIVLLIGVPAGYLVISANQSRDSGKDKEKKYSATGLTEGWPSRVQRRLYHLPVPSGSDHVAYYETNNWKTSRLYIQFLTSEKGLDKFLKRIGSSRAALERDELAVTARDRRIVGWEFTGPGPWSGLTRERKNPTPTLDIVVNWSKRGHPMVYAVSRTTP
ncbi:sugar kinase [Streptomyces sporangiiformans]|uniref:Sugar kinase n=1 Tax=Streptomyces sporangiiformans TaxID=2315329 RepID=A0A505D2K3_9ACTN|nr:sugar kinase [Streptomyces sporangiiformans]TPQ17924.1 sugar kinase [Streptomyces sporangiiformans]